MSTGPRSSRLLVVVALAAIPGCMCGPGYGSLGDHATDTGSGGDSGTHDGDGGATSDGDGGPECGAIPLADIASGVGGFALDGEAEEDWSGASVGGAGDVNGDGLADVIVGAPRADPNGVQWSGRAYVVFGKEDTNAVSLSDVAQGIGGFAMDGDTAYDTSGVSVSEAGDMNGDGLADVIVGAAMVDPAGVGSGRTYVVFGRADTARVQLADVAQGIGGFVLVGEADGDRAGYAASGAGDVNGDGIPDVIVGADRADPDGLDAAGRTYVVFGKTDTNAVSLADVAQGTGGFILDGEAGSDHSGQSVSSAGDVNGDGLADVIVGAPRTDQWGVGRSGRSYVVFGKPDTQAISLGDVTLGQGGFILDGEMEKDHSGRSVSAAGDVNGDGLADVVVGAPGELPFPTSISRAHVVFGKADTESVALADVVLGSGGFTLEGVGGGDASGWSVSEAGDVNDDGLADVIVGAPHGDPNESQSGRAYVVFGKADTGKVQHEHVGHGIGGFALDGETGDNNAGRSVSSAGDVNGDGIPDIIVGAPYASPNGAQSGRTYVVFGGDFSCGGG